MEQGLAQQLASPQGTAPMGQPKGGPTIEDVVTLLMQGAKPEELIQMGIPEQMIIDAINMIKQQQGGGMSPESEPQGLAASSVGM